MEYSKRVIETYLLDLNVHTAPQNWSFFIFTLLVYVNSDWVEPARLRPPADSKKMRKLWWITEEESLLMSTSETKW